MSLRLRLGLLLALAAVSVGAAVQLASGATGHAAAARKYGAKVTYKETSSGHSSGGAQVDIHGTGTFSATLSPRAALEAAVIAASTGIPVTEIVKGGTYTVERAIGKTGRITGTLVATFKARGLGTACARYVEKPGKYVVGDSFVPMSGTITTVGGVGAAARWHLTISFTQTGISGIKVEQFAAKGAESGAIGRARGMNKTCRSVAKLPKH